MGDGLLDGLRVLDIGIWRPAPYAASLLADLGADVLKVEPPGGDPMRAFPDLFDELNRNKRGIVLDLKDRADRARALELARDADVVVEGYRPGVAARLGVGYDDVRAVNESVVYCSVSGYGQDGPLANAPGHDLNYQALGGALFPRDGSAPAVPGVPIADLAAGTVAALAVCAAVIARSRTGRGDYVDVGMAEVMAAWTGPFPMTRVEGAAPMRGGVPSYGVFATTDGYVALGIVAEEHFWRNLCDALSLGDLREVPMLQRLARCDELRARLAGEIARYRRDEIVERLVAADVPASPVLTPEEMLRHPHFVDRGTVTSTPWGEPSVALPIRFARRPATPPRRAPKLDEHAGQGFPAPR